MNKAKAKDKKIYGNGCQKARAMGKKKFRL
jgi:hypothetical protein